MVFVRNSGVVMPFKVVSGAGVGAAAVIVGLSLAGPQALGVANADTAATDSTSVSAGPADPSAVSGQTSSPARPAASRAGRGVKPSESVVSRVEALPSADVTSARVARGLTVLRDQAVTSARHRPAASSNRVQSATSRLSVFGAAVAEPSDGGQAEADVLLDAPEATAVPLTVVGAADGAAEPGRAIRGAAIRGLGDRAPGSFGDQAVESLYNMFDSASIWLNTLPAGPLTDFLQGALLLARRAILPYGGGVSLGQYNLPTEPARDFNTGDKLWYEYTPTLQATPGAPMQGGARAILDQDGVQGRILNNTPYAIVVKSSRAGSMQAVLLPGERMPYQLSGGGGFDFYRYDGSATPVKQRATYGLWLSDPFIGYPSVSFQIPGSTVGTRSYSEGDSHYEIWGDTTFWVKRENDGWKINASQAFLDRYPDPNTWATSDWAIFTIHIDSLAANTW